MTDEESDLEEVLLAYLRSSKKIKLAKLHVADAGDTTQYTVRFEVSDGFPGNLTRQISDTFSGLPTITQDNEHTTTEKQEV
tara:strand:+ start:133163 stop:133405 length:243 start_codon:yes stop_codon:yes gene_type:complete